jgi:U1 small nuclear ribonucleoprotein C
MPKYFCEYCGIYLTHSSPGGRKQHSHGRKHINNKIEYYSQFLYEFQQNTYNNMMTMASKIPATNPMNQFQNIPIMQQKMLRPGIQLINPMAIAPQNLPNSTN